MCCLFDVRNARFLDNISPNTQVSRWALRLRFAPLRASTHGCHGDVSLDTLLKGVKRYVPVTPAKVKFSTPFSGLSFSVVACMQFVWSEQSNALDGHEDVGKGA